MIVLECETTECVVDRSRRSRSRTKKIVVKVDLGRKKLQLEREQFEDKSWTIEASRERTPLREQATQWASESNRPCQETEVFGVVSKKALSGISWMTV